MLSSLLQRAGVTVESIDDDGNENSPALRLVGFSEIKGMSTCDRIHHALNLHWYLSISHFFYQQYMLNGKKMICIDDGIREMLQHRTKSVKKF